MSGMLCDGDAAEKASCRPAHPKSVEHPRRRPATSLAGQAPALRESPEERSKGGSHALSRGALVRRALPHPRSACGGGQTTAAVIEFAPAFARRNMDSEGSLIRCLLLGSLERTNRTWAAPESVGTLRPVPQIREEDRRAMRLGPPDLQRRSQPSRCTWPQACRGDPPKPRNPSDCPNARWNPVGDSRGLPRRFLPLPSNLLPHDCTAKTPKTTLTLTVQRFI